MSSSPTCAVPGMLHARVHPSAARGLQGAGAIDEASIKGIRGARVIREKDFVAVVAPKEWDAVRGGADAEGRLGAD